MIPFDERGEMARSVVSRPRHGIVSLDRYASKRPIPHLVGLRLADGKLERTQVLPGAGEVKLSDGLLFLSENAGIRAFAPV